MEETSSQFSPSSSSIIKAPKKYDVFLSFRGEDTRYNFIAHLYVALRRQGIYTFIDDRKLERGKLISPELLQAIEDSTCSIIVLSRNYASSTWCLNELLKILESNTTMGQIVIPIFYHVEPSHVRKQIGAFGEAFAEHEQVFANNMERVQRWRDALKHVANLSGWTMQKDRDEAIFIQEIVADISNRVIMPLAYIPKDLVGIGLRMKKLNSYVQIGFDDVRMIGICGMGGLGKTTIAQAYYNSVCSRFDGTSFLANVREAFEKHGITSLQEKLVLETLTKECTKIRNADKSIRTRLRYRRVLIILDDVDQINQLKDLAGSLDWFGPGSRILITTRDKSLLSKHGVTLVYEVEQLNHDEAIQLFSWNAFKDTHLFQEYIRLANDVLAYAKGLPLALQVLGSFLYGKSANEWRSALNRLKEYPKREIIDVLHLSFEGLEETEKNIFLDIACFFKGRDKDFVTKIASCCGFYPEISIRTLIDKSLLTIRDGKIWMHDLVEEMGREIIRKGSHKDPGCWSRLWLYEDFCHVLSKNLGTEVEAICVSSSKRKTGNQLSLQAFSKMKKLRLLCITGDYCWDVLSSHSCENLFSEYLLFVKWEGYPFKYLPSSFQPCALIELHMEFSSIEQLYNGQLIKPWYNLKTINLSHSRSLIKIQGLQVVPNLEELLLSFCTSLEEIDSSIIVLERLTLMDLKCCFSLKSIPNNMHQLKSLKVLNFESCSNLQQRIEHSDRLEELNLSSALRKSVGKSLLSPRLYYLKRLNLSKCLLFDDSFPDDYFRCLVSLEQLDLSSNCFKKLPPGLSRLPKLKYLHLDDCQSLKWLGELPPSLLFLTTVSCIWLQDPIVINQCNLRCSTICVDCPDLVLECEGCERMLMTSLKRYVLNMTSPSERFDIVVPGTNIPNWFIHQNVFSSLSLDLESNWCNESWMGFVLCLVYDAERSIRGFQGELKINGLDWGLGTINLPYDFSIDYYETDPRTQVGFSHGHARQEYDHVWLIYLPRIICLSPQFRDNSSCRIQFSFQCNSIVKCGVRLLYKNDIEELEAPT